MTRVFDAPRSLVWDALTKHERLKRWFFGPPGWSLVVCEVALQLGAAYRYMWRGPDGSEMGMRGVCRDIVPPESSSPPKRVRIHHVGSPPIPGISAKPILDLMPVVRDLALLDNRRRAFERLGYEWWGEYGLTGATLLHIDRFGHRSSCTAFEKRVIAG
jgi:hypothetical protein